MKLPASVLAEALSPLGAWTYAGEKKNARYAFPRLFEGQKGERGCTLLLSSTDPGQAESLSVRTAPRSAAVPRVGEELCPEREVSASAVMALLTALFDRVENWEETLSDCSLDMAGIREMLERSAHSMGGLLTLVDVSYHIPASTGGVLLQSHPDRGHLDDAAIAQLADDPAMTAIRSVRGVNLYESAGEGHSGRSTLYRNMFRPGESVYYNRLLFSRPTGRYSSTDRFMLEHLAERVERITEHLPTFSVPVSQVEALKRLILQLPDSAWAQEEHLSLLSALGWKKEHGYRFFIFRSLYPQRDTGITEYILRRLERLIPASCGAMDGERILLVQNCDCSGVSPGELRPRLAEFLRENLYKAGVSGPIRSFSMLRGGYLQAEAALRIGQERDPMLWYFPFENYLGDYLMRKAAEDIPPSMLLLPGVEELLRWDAAKGTRFAETLRVYAEENFNATHAAAKLFIHRTSFQDRMERIRAITGLELEDAETRFLLQFSFRLRENRQEP